MAGVKFVFALPPTQVGLPQLSVLHAARVEVWPMPISSAPLHDLSGVKEVMPSTKMQRPALSGSGQRHPVEGR